MYIYQSKNQCTWRYTSFTKIQTLNIIMFSDIATEKSYRHRSAMYPSFNGFFEHGSIVVRKANVKSGNIYNSIVIQNQLCLKYPFYVHVHITIQCLTSYCFESKCLQSMFISTTNSFLKKATWTTATQHLHLRTIYSKLYLWWSK